MGKKGKTGVGRAVLKHRSRGASLGKGKQSWLHTSELNDGEELNTKSVTEQSTLDEFLTTAELAGTEFIAEKLNISICNADHSGGLPSRKEEERIQEVQDQHKQFLQIPRRPKWDEKTTPEQLDQLEKENFLVWRRALAELQAEDDLILTPFERNLEFWRQLWRVIERSNVVVQIVDARNPLLFRCEDLESYVTEVNNDKMNVLLINKADFLTQKQRETWASYFKSIDVKAIFWSAVFETERLKQMKVLEKNEMKPSQSVAEEPDAILTEDHVSPFLYLQQEPEDTASHESDFDGQIDLRRHDSLESEASKHMPFEKETLKNCPFPNEATHNDSNSTQNVPIKNEAESTTKRGMDSSSQCDGKEVSLIYDKPSNKDTFRTCNDHQAEQIATSSSSSSDVLEISQLNLEPNDEETQDCRDDTTNNIYSDVRKTSEKSENRANNNDGYIAGKDVEFYTSGHLLTGEEILAYCQWLHRQYGGCMEIGREDKEEQTVIGLVGYPNVGKSSTINAILQAKKVPVSSTPGRTKHFQTLLVDKTICLCDCPGLVFPSFVSTKAEMVVSGILPIDQLRDHVPPVTLVCRRIPRDVLEAVYGVNLTKPEEWEDPERPPYAEELLDAYSHSRGFLTRQGRSDGPRSSRYILKDYVNGRLLYCHPPPAIDPKDFQMAFTSDVKTVKKRPVAVSKQNETNVNKMDGEFFKQEDVKFHTSATTGTEQYRRLMQAAQADPKIVVVGKPWKKHGNRNKKEKLRRLKPSGY